MIKKILLLLIALSLFSCSRDGGDAAHVHHTQFFAFGTVIELSLFGVDDSLAKAAEVKAREDFELMHFAWHPYEAGPLGRINSLLATESQFSYAPSSIALIRKGIEYEKLSEGFFNPAMGELVKLWGFDRPETLEGRQPPVAAEIEKLVKKVPSTADIEIEGLQMRATRPGVTLDFGGLAKGFGIDQVVAELKTLGVRNAIVNAGGDLRAIGNKNGKPWVIGVRHPRNNGILAAIEVSGDESIFTSGDYERFYEFEGRRYSHILNPYTGYPADDFQSVTVLATDAALADAAATAISVAGAKHWRRIAKKMGVNRVMLVTRQGKVLVTPAMRKRADIQGVADKDIVVSAL